MPFGVANAPTLFQELRNKKLSILGRRPVVQNLISRGAQREAHIDDVCLGMNTQEDHPILLVSPLRSARRTTPKSSWRSVSSCRRPCSTWALTFALVVDSCGL